MNSDDPEKALQRAETFRHIYDRFFDRIYNYIYLRCFEAELSDDLTAQVFERVLNGFDRYDPKKGGLAPWLFTIARNTLTDHWRRTRRFQWLPLDFLRLSASPERGPEARLLADEETLALLNAVKKLDKREQDIIGLKFSGRLNNREIARITGLGENHVAVIIYRAVRKLRDELTQNRSGN